MSSRDNGNNRNDISGADRLLHANELVFTANFNRGYLRHIWNGGEIFYGYRATRVEETIVVTKRDTFQLSRNIWNLSRWKYE